MNPDTLYGYAVIRCANDNTGRFENKVVEDTFYLVGVDGENNGVYEHRGTGAELERSMICRTEMKALRAFANEELQKIHKIFKQGKQRKRQLTRLLEANGVPDTRAFLGAMSPPGHPDREYFDAILAEAQEGTN